MWIVIKNILNLQCARIAHYALCQYTQWISYCYSTTYQDPVAAVTVVKSTTTLSQHKVLQESQLEMCVCVNIANLVNVF